MGAGKDERVGKAAEWSQTEDLTGYKAPEPMGSQARQCVFLIPMLSSRRKKKRCKIPGSLLAQPPGYSVTTRKFSHQHLRWSSDPTERREKWGGRGGEERRSKEEGGKTYFRAGKMVPTKPEEFHPRELTPTSCLQTPTLMPLRLHTCVHIRTINK